MRACICDDNRDDLRLLTDYVREFGAARPELNMSVEPFASPLRLLESVGSGGGFDLYILDVLMPQMNGIELGKELRAGGARPWIIYLTVSKEYAVEAFKVKASGYLVKPVDRDQLLGELEEWADSLSPEGRRAVLIKTRSGVRRVFTYQIALVESFDHSREVTLSSGERLATSATLRDIYGELSCEERFFRPHRAYIINMDYVKGFGPGKLIMADGKYVPISRKLYGEFKAAYMDRAFKG